METVERFTLKSDVAGLMILLLVKEEFLLGVAAVFLKTVSLFEIPSISLAISFESSWYYISNDCASRLVSFLSIFEIAFELMLTTLSSIMDTSYVFTLTFLLRGGDGLEVIMIC